MGAEVQFSGSISEEIRRDRMSSERESAEAVPPEQSPLRINMFIDPPIDLNMPMKPMDLHQLMPGSQEMAQNGCSCRRSKCQHKSCGCRKKGRYCGPGCACHHCLNMRAKILFTTQIENCWVYMHLLRR